MVTVTLKDIVPATPPVGGWKVEYRVKGSSSAYTLATGSPFASQPIIFNVAAEPGTLFEGRIIAMCATNNSVVHAWHTPCNCTNAGDGTGGWAPVTTNDNCHKIQSKPPSTTLNSCFASMQHGAYSGFGTRVYNLGWNNASLFIPWLTADATIHSYLTVPDQWKGRDDGGAPGNGANPKLGPMNRSGVWLDDDCDGDADAQAGGAVATASLQYTNNGLARTIHIGVGGDNDFKLKINGLLIVDTNLHAGDYQFKIWHVLPVTLPKGLCLFNIEVANATGKSSPSCMAMVVYDTSNPADFAVATGDASGGYNRGLTILADTVTLITTSPVPIITCPPGYSANTQGTLCIRTIYDICNEAAANPSDDCSFTKTFSYVGNDYHIYEDVFLDLAGVTTTTVNWDVFSRPNRISIFNDTTGVLIVTSGWVGVAAYAGPWGPNPPGLSTSLTGTMSFNPVAGNIYRLLVESGGADPISPASDSCFVYLSCV